MSDKKTAETPAEPDETSDQRHQPDPLPVTTEAEAEGMADTPDSSRPRRYSLLMLPVALLALLALAVSGAVAWLAHNQVGQTTAQVQALQVAIGGHATQQQLHTALEPLQQLERQQQQLQQQWAAALHQQNQQLEQLQQALLKAAEPKPRDWLLAEAEYLLRVANQRLQLEEDVQGALTLFLTADQRLKQADVPGTLAIRARLLEDIEALRSIEPLDRLSLVLALQEMADQALMLQVMQLPSAPALDLNRLASSPQTLRWYEALWQEIRSLVVIRKRELPIESLPFTEDELALRHQLSALLQQAAWAALRGETPLYQSSLERATVRLTGFDPALASTQRMQQQLQAMQQQPVSRTLPNAQTSLDALQAFITQRYGVALPVVPETEPQRTAP
jgi:uroporphyrin-III C-methyltransferase